MKTTKLPQLNELQQLRDEAAEMIGREAAGACAETLGKRPMATVRMEGEMTTLTILEDDAGNAVRTLTKTPDGTIDDDCHRPLLREYTEIADLQYEAKLTIYRLLAERKTPRTIGMMAGQHNGPLYTLILEDAEKAADTATSLVRVLGRERRIKPQDRRSETNRLIRSHIADGGALALSAKLLSNRNAVTSKHHNIALKCRKGILETAEEEENLAALYLASLGRPADRTATKVKLVKLAMARTKTPEENRDLFITASHFLLNPRCAGAGTALGAITKAAAAMGLDQQDIRKGRATALFEAQAACEDAASAPDAVYAEWLEKIGKMVNDDNRRRRRLNSATQKFLRERETRANVPPRPPWALAEQWMRTVREASAVRHLLEELMPEAVQKAQEIRPTAKTDGSVSFMTDEENPPCWKLTAEADGTLSLEVHGHPSEGGRLPPEHHPAEELRAWARGELLESLESRWKGSRLRLIELIWPAKYAWPHAANAWTEAQETLTAAATGPGDEDATASPHSLDILRTRPALRRAAEEAATAVETDLISPDNRTHRQAWFQEDRAATLYAHNWTALNADMFTSLERKHRGLTRYFINQVLGPEEAPRRLTPSEVVARTKNHTQLNGSAWKVFLRMNPSTLIATSGSARTSETTALCQAIAEANVPGAEPGDLARVAVTGRASATYAAESQETWRAWTRLVSAYLRREGRERGGWTLNHVVNAFDHHLAESGRPWGPGDWQVLQNRTGRWHDRLDVEETRGMTNQELASTWTLALPEHQDNGAVITPADNGRKLLDAAQEMNNCLATMAAGSIAGTRAIYLIKREGKVTAAVELLNTGSQWRTGQVESSGHARPTDEDLRTAEALAARYSEAAG